MEILGTVTRKRTTNTPLHLIIARAGTFLQPSIKQRYRQSFPCLFAKKKIQTSQPTPLHYSKTDPFITASRSSSWLLNTVVQIMSAVQSSTRAIPVQVTRLCPARCSRPVVHHSTNHWHVLNQATLTIVALLHPTIRQAQPHIASSTTSVLNSRVLIINPSK